MRFLRTRIRNLSSVTMFIFGVLALLLGLVGLIRPEFTLNMLGLETLDRAQRINEDYTLTFITASSMASFNVGVYYVLASLNNLKQFYWWTVPFRMVTFTVFVLAVASGIAPAGFLGVAVWELAGSLLTGLALLYERKRNIE